MNVERRIKGKRVNEMVVLNLLYSLCAIIYLLLQLIIYGFVSDYLFIMLLSFGTFFLNLRQKMLFEKLYDDKTAIEYYKIHNLNDYKYDMEIIFNNRLIDFIAVVWGCIFGVVVSFVLTAETNYTLKVFYALFLASANIPTALAVYRLYKLYKFYVKIIDNMNYNFYDANNSDVTFVVSLRDFVLFTVIIYATACLTSVLFTKINLGMAYKLYTGIAIVIIIVVFTYSNYYIYKNKNAEVNRIRSILDSKINNEYKRVCDSNDYLDFEKLENYRKYRESLEERRFNFTKVIDAIKLVGITALPLLIEWFLNKN